MHFDSLSRSKQKHCFCAAKTFARLDRANDIPLYCCVRAGCFLSHNASPLTCCLALRLFRFGFDFVFWFKLVCRREPLDYLVSAAALILFDQESPSPLACLNNYVLLKHRDSRFFLLSRRVTTFGAEARLDSREKSRISTLLCAVSARGIPAFVYQNAKYGNKRGIKEKNVLQMVQKCELSYIQMFR